MALPTVHFESGAFVIGSDSVSTVHAVAAYHTDLHEDEVERIQSLSTWQWGNLAVTRPLEVPDPTVEWEAGDITIGTTSVSHVQAAVAYDESLPWSEVQFLTGLDVWRWVIIGGAIVPSFPAYESGNMAIRTEVYATDRDNQERVSLGLDVLDISADWNINRGGAKSSVRISSHTDVLKDGMWIAPVVNLIPEVGDIIQTQVGHFKLVTPSTSYDGTAAENTTATGRDIIEDIANVRLSETFATPPDTVIMEEVLALIKMATAGRLSPTLLLNGTFTDSLAPWSQIVGSNGVIAWSSIGDGSARVGFDSSAPVGAACAVAQVVAIPPGTQFIAVSGLSNNPFTQQIQPQLWVDFRDENNTVIDAYVHYPRPRTNKWVRAFTVMPVPVGTHNVRVYARAIVHTASGLSPFLRWREVRVGTATMMPIPESRISLPISDASSTSLIQSVGGARIGIDAINDHRLSSINHHALTATLDGSPTTMPSRNTQGATPRRVYQDGDYRYVGTIDIERTATNRYNHVVAIMSDIEEPSNSIVANAYNMNSNDEWSVPRMGLESVEIRLTDVESEAELQAIAEAHLARASMSEQITIQVLPDPNLSVYDVIEIASGPPKAIGKWAIETITPGYTERNPLVRITARRTLTSGGAV